MVLEGLLGCWLLWEVSFEGEVLDLLSSSGHHRLDFWVFDGSKPGILLRIDVFNSLTGEKRRFGRIA